MPSTRVLSTRRGLGALALSAACLPLAAHAAAPAPLAFSYQRSSALFIVLIANGELARPPAAGGVPPAGLPRGPGLGRGAGAIAKMGWKRRVNAHASGLANIAPRSARRKRKG